MNNNYLVIMAGGVGSRFWPFSRQKKPKQFLDILGVGSSLLQLTYQRFLSICPKENIFIVTNQDYGPLVAAQLPDLTKDQILLETARRNTAPCIAYACYKILARNPKANIVVTPADHAVFKEQAFQDAIKLALSEADNTDKIITLGIAPTRPETGYGYIRFANDDQPIKKVTRFTEKPDLETAQKFVASGEYVWNAGIFIWNIQTIIKSLEEFLPETAALFRQGLDKYYQADEEGFIKAVYQQCESISIDYAVMEKSPNVYVISGDFSWSDLGSWATLHEIRDKDQNGNVIDGNALTYDCKDCIVMGPEDKLIVAQGLDNYLITFNDDVILICDKNNEKQFRVFVADVNQHKDQKFS